MTAGAERFDAVVVGAGPAGSATAILLARAGWSVALVEKQPFPRRKVCGECVAASNIGLLETLGVWRRLEPLAGAGLRRVSLLHGMHPALEAPLPVGDDAHPWGRAIGREHLDLALADAARAAGATLLQPTALQSIAGRAGAFALALHTTDDRAHAARRIDAGVVVAAHGSWQPLAAERETLPPRRGRDLLAFKANFRDAAIAADALPVLSFRGGYGGMVVEGDGLATVACCVRADRLGSEREGRHGERAGAIVEAMLKRECAGVAKALDGATRLGPWLAAGPIRPGVRLGDRRDGVAGVFRVGNAAGEAHPIVGEGISMALQSAFVLASVIATAREALLGGDAAAAQRAALRRYEALWRRRFGHRLRVAAAFAHAAMRPAWTPWLVGAVRACPDLLTAGARWAGKTHAVAEAPAASARARAELAPDPVATSAR